MALKLTWYGHATWGIEFGGKKIIVDPFFDQNPACSKKASEIECDLMLITHGHGDHIADAAAIGKRTKAQIVCVFEIAEWLGKQGVTNLSAMNLGGTLKLPFGSIKMTPAFHSSALPDGSNGGVAGGFVLNLGGRRIYFSGDTALFSDMNLIGEMGIEVAVIPIGDLYTMGIEDSVTATNLINPKFVVPSHYNTWPPIEQDAGAWADAIQRETSAEPIVLAAGQSHEFSAFAAN